MYFYTFIKEGDINKSNSYLYFVPTLGDNSKITLVFGNKLIFEYYTNAI